MAVINPAHQMLKLDKFQTLVSDVYTGGGATKRSEDNVFQRQFNPLTFFLFRIKEQDNY